MLYIFTRFDPVVIARAALLHPTTNQHDTPLLLWPARCVHRPSRCA